MRIKRLDIVTRTPVFANIPDGDMVAITIPLTSYLRLVSWASMSRTLNNALEAAITAENEIAADELTDLHKALCDCHTACRNHWGEHVEDK